jgi:hypothetical protein
MRTVVRATVLLTMAIILLSRAASGQERPGAQAGKLFDLANQERAEQGLPKLKWDEALAATAQKHADRMAKENSLSHQFADEGDVATRAADAGAHFSLFEENIAEGPSPESIHATWLASKPHRENMLNPVVDSVGIGVSEGSGQLFAVEDFSAAVPNLSIQRQEEQISALLNARGLHLLANTSDAEQACKTGHGFAAKPQPRSVTHFEAMDLNELPSSLEKMIQSGRYKSATVGACPADSPPGFVMYRLAVLLY